MDNPFLVGVLDGFADRNEQPQALRRAHPLQVAIAGDGDALHQFHHEIGSA